MFKNLIDSDRAKAHEFFASRQKMYERTKSTILLISLIGAPLLYVLLRERYGGTDGTFLFFLTAVSYGLGYAYCKVDWSKSKEWSTYHTELGESNETPSRDA